MNIANHNDSKVPNKEFFSPKASLLTAEQEISLAQDIERLDVHTWTVLLGFAPATGWIVEQCNSALHKFNIGLEHVQLLSERYIQKRDDESYKKFTKAAVSVSKDIRKNDLDRNVLHDLLKKIDELTPDNADFTTTSDALVRYKTLVTESYNASQKRRDQFAVANFGLTITVAKRYLQRHLDLADLVQEGQLGLLKAVDRFDYRRGLRFSTFATWWIRHAVGRSVSDKSRLIRLPVHLLETQQKIKRVQSELTQTLGRNPTDDEIANKLKLKRSKVREVLATAARKVDSIDQPSGKDDASRDYAETLYVPEHANDSFAKDVETKSVFSKVKSMMRYLRPVELDIINKRFGLDGGDGATLQEIANGMALSRERVRQIQNKALEKMRGGLRSELAA